MDGHFFEDCRFCKNAGKIYIVVFTQKPDHIGTFIRQDKGNMLSTCPVCDGKGYLAKAIEKEQ